MPICQTTDHRQPTRRPFFKVLCGTTLLLCGGELAVAGADGQRAPAPQIFLDSQGIAIGGFDLVSYFTNGKAQRGIPRWKAEHKGARFLFAEEMNLKLFLEKPEKYLPRFNGHCAYSMSQNTVRTCDPRRFAVKDGQLYLFGTETVRQRWLDREAVLIAKAAEFWRSLINP